MIRFINFSLLSSSEDKSVCLQKTVLWKARKKLKKFWKIFKMKLFAAFAVVCLLYSSYVCANPTNKVRNVLKYAGEVSCQVLLSKQYIDSRSF